MGHPYLDGASVKADVLDQIKDDKIDVIKFKRRKGYKRKQGHRQGYLRVRVSKISCCLNGDRQGYLRVRVSKISAA